MPSWPWHWGSLHGVCCKHTGELVASLTLKILNSIPILDTKFSWFICGLHLYIRFPLAMYTSYKRYSARPQFKINLTGCNINLKFCRIASSLGRPWPRDWTFFADNLSDVIYADRAPFHLNLIVFWVFWILLPTHDASMQELVMQDHKQKLEKSWSRCKKALGMYNRSIIYNILNIWFSLSTDLAIWMITLRRTWV